MPATLGLYRDDSLFMRRLVDLCHHLDALSIEKSSHEERMYAVYHASLCYEGLSIEASEALRKFFMKIADQGSPKPDNFQGIRVAVENAMRPTLQNMGVLGHAGYFFDKLHKWLGIGQFHPWRQPSAVRGLMWGVVALAVVTLPFWAILGWGGAGIAGVVAVALMGARYAWQLRSDRSVETTNLKSIVSICEAEGSRTPAESQRPHDRALSSKNEPPAPGMHPGVTHESGKPFDKLEPLDLKRPI